MDSTLTRIHREGEIRWRCHSDAVIPFPHPLSPNSEKGSRSMGRSPRSSPGDPRHLKGFGLGEGMPALWPTSLTVQLQVSRPWPQEYESKHQNLLAQQERRLQGAWRNVVVVFPDTGWEAYSYYWLIVNTRSFFSSDLARSLQRIGMVPWPLCLFNRCDGWCCPWHPLLLPSVFSRDSDSYSAERCAVQFGGK